MNNDEYLSVCYAAKIHLIQRICLLVCHVYRQVTALAYCTTLDTREWEMVTEHDTSSLVSFLLPCCRLHLLTVFEVGDLTVIWKQCLLDIFICLGWVLCKLLIIDHKYAHAIGYLFTYVQNCFTDVLIFYCVMIMPANIQHCITNRYFHFDIVTAIF